MSATRTSSFITTSSALVLGAGGIVLLFGSDVLLPRLVPGASASATVLGQLISAGWLALAWLNWNQRRMLVGGIYGRPTVLANLMLYLVSAFSLGHPAMGGGASPVLLFLTVVFGVLAVVYGALLMRGPFGNDTPAEADTRA
ncbi:hypothetical protein [Frateuria soli]|uniref:hypothetical protein n=1 Tax=Frateuria soli TaxID=1542730 RepID=UPI001E4C3AB8|nr:hypothetical protein [Frateuria soli]UGB36822.1 hypothetical protein LQ771_08175 [Frateuria soli]